MADVSRSTAGDELGERYRRFDQAWEKWAGTPPTTADIKLILDLLWDIRERLKALQEGSLIYLPLAGEPEEIAGPFRFGGLSTPDSENAAPSGTQTEGETK